MTPSRSQAPRLASASHQPYAKLPPYLHRRGTQFYFKRKIPSDAAGAFPGHRQQTWKALGTHLLEKARVMLAVEVSEFEFILARHRRERAAKVAGIEARTAAVAPSAQSSANGAETVPHTHDHEHHDLVRILEQGLERLRTMTTRGASTPQPASVAPKVTVKKPAVQSNAEHRAVQGGPVKGKIQLTLSHLLEDWKLKQTRHRTVKTVTTTVNEFRELLGPLPVFAITRQHARDYRDLLIERRLSKGTVENRIGYLSSLVRHGMVEMVEDLPANPFEKINLSGVKGSRAPKDRRAFSVSELNLIFESKLYTTGYRPDGQSVEAAYWTPLLGPFLGARLEELCQLRIEDVQRVNGVWCVRICDLDENQELKNSGSFRRVPLHQTVINCGFLLYAAKIAKAGHERLFPSLTNENSNQIFSNSVGKWFGRYLDGLGLRDPRLDYQSYRYVFRQQASLSGIETETRDALTGHWLNSTDAGRTYLRGENNQYPFPKLVSAIELLRYDELKIGHLYVQNPMQGVEEALLK